MHYLEEKNVHDQQYGEDGQSYIPNSENLVPTHSKKVQRIEIEKIDFASLERDPRKRPRIWEHPINQFQVFYYIIFNSNYIKLIMIYCLI